VTRLFSFSVKSNAISPLVQSHGGATLFPPPRGRKRDDSPSLFLPFREGGDQTRRVGILRPHVRQAASRKRQGSPLSLPCSRVNEPLSLKEKFLSPRDSFSPNTSLNSPPPPFPHHSGSNGTGRTSTSPSPSFFLSSTRSAALMTNPPPSRRW